MTILALPESRAEAIAELTVLSDLMRDLWAILDEEFPKPGQLAAAPVIDSWISTPSKLQCIRGLVQLDANTRLTEITTLEAWAIDRQEKWVRTRDGRYRLGSRWPDSAREEGGLQ